MSPQWRRAAAVAVAVVAVAAILAGCGSDGSRTPGRGQPSVAAPLPVGVQDPAVIPSVSAAPAASCEPRASLRPQGLPAPGQPPPGSTMAAIVQRGRLIVGVDQNTYLFGFRDPASGELTGFDIDIAHEIAQALFGDPGKIQFKTISSADRIPVIERNEVDLVVRTMTMTCDRWEKVSFSSEYFTAGQRVLVTRDSTAKGMADLGGKKVCATAGSTSIRTIAAAQPKPIPVSVVDWTDCLVMLQQGQVAAISTDDTILAGLAAQDPNTRVVGERITQEPYGVAMAKAATDLVRFVNAVLERIRADGTWHRIYQQWLSQWLSGLGEVPVPPAATYRD